MHSSEPADDGENLQTEGGHQELGLHRMPFLFARIRGPLMVRRAFNRLFGDIQHDGQEAWGESGFVSREPQLADQPAAIALIEFMRIGFADAKLLA